MSSKVVLIAETFREPGTPGSTGGTLYNYHLVRALSCKFNVEVRCLNAGPWPTLSDVSFVPLNDSAAGRTGRRMFTWRRDLRDALEGVEYGATIISTSATNALLIERSGNAFRHVAIVQAYEDFGIRVPTRRLSERWRGLKRLVASGQGCRGSLGRADYVIYNSRFVGDQVRRLVGADVATRLLYPPLTIDYSADPHFTTASKKRVGFVNRHGKNATFVLELARACPNFEFLFFGHDLDRIGPVPSNVILRGWSTSAREMFAEAYSWVMPSEWEEPFGLVALEALSQGCRVAVSSRGGLPEAVGRFGRVFNTFNVPDWREWLVGGDSPAGITERFGHLSQFSLPSFCRNVETIFSEVRGQSGHSNMEFKARSL